MLAHKTWVLIADGEKALFLENVTDEDDPNLVIRRVDEQDNPPSREQGANRPGRAPGAGGTTRAVVEDTDWHQLAKERFAHDLADTLYKMVHRKRFERLVLVAAPHVLGEIRRTLHAEVAATIVAEVPKTLTNHPLDQIERIVATEVAGD